MQATLPFRLSSKASLWLPAFVIVLALMLPMFFHGAQARAESWTGSKPNIIWIMADDLGYGDLGAFGQKLIKTPVLDQMAREGMKFTSVYAGSTVCAPSRCVLMTGYHTGHCRVRGNARIPLEPDDVTVAEVLKSAGYSTALCGKWGLGEAETQGIPNKQGFDHFFGYLKALRRRNHVGRSLIYNPTPTDS